MEVVRSAVKRQPVDLHSHLRRDECHIDAVTADGMIRTPASDARLLEKSDEKPLGGGVRTVEDVRRLLNAGADKTSFNSAAIANPDTINACSDKYGAQCIVVAIDAKRRTPEDEQRIGPGGTPMGPGWDVYSHGGRKNVGLDVIRWAEEMAQRGAGEILLTSMDKDGTKSGFDLQLTRAVSDAVGVPVIASGGVGNLDHLADGVQQGGADAVLAASIFHYGEYTIAQAKERMRERGIPVRL